MDVHRNNTIFSTKPPRQNATEIVYVPQYDVTELTIIVWTVGGVLLIVLLALLGRIVLARRKDPFSQMGYQRQRNNVLRIRIDSECMAHPREHGFMVPRDTSALVTGSTVQPTESPVSQRNHSSNRTTQENTGRSINRDPHCVASSANNTTLSATRIRCSTASVDDSRNLIGSNSGTDYDVESSAVYDADVTPDGNQGSTNEYVHVDESSARANVQQSTSAIRPNVSISTTDYIYPSHNCQNYTLSRESLQHSQTNQENVQQRTQLQLSVLSNGTTGSRAVLSNGVVISPPPYCDVINTTGRLPSIVVSRPPGQATRRLLFSL